MPSLKNVFGKKGESQFTPHQKNASDEVGGTNKSVAVGGQMPPTSDTFGEGFTPDLETAEKTKAAKQDIKKAAQEQAGQLREQVDKMDQHKPKFDQDIPQAAPAPAKDTTQAPVARSVQLKQIENILQEDLEDIYFKMNDAQRRLFKAEGERAARQIDQIIASGKSVVVKVLEVIKRWLKFIPGINKFFIEQEAKIKTDKVLDINPPAEKPGK